MASRVGVSLPEVEVVFRNVTVGAEAHVANRALPSIPNYFLDLAEVLLPFLALCTRLALASKPNEHQVSLRLCSITDRIEP